MIRTPKTIKTVCSHCNGRGHVQSQEFFNLTTPEEWCSRGWGARKATFDPNEGEVPADAYGCFASPGSRIFDTCQEAKQIATLLNCPVAFEFNGKNVVVRAEDEVQAIVDDWWMRAYGKLPPRTYQESR
jgi:DnaJ-class molecular chaperone